MGRLSTQILTTALLAAPALALQTQQPPLFRVNVRLVRVLATVKDRAGKLVGSLDKSDFSIYDNGALQEISVFERLTKQPLSISVLIDTSSSTAKDLGYEIESLNRFFKALLRSGNPADAAALYQFDYNVTQLQGFTHRVSVLEDRLKRVKGTGGTSLYDALWWGARDLELRQGRHVIVVVTDGGNTTSVRDFHQALEGAQLADAVIYPILVVPITNDAGRNIGGEHALATLAAGTGGRVFWPSIGPALDAAFSDILMELRTQYLLGYYPKNVPLTKNRFHSLEIRLRRPDLRAMARNGYYGEFEHR
jgi:Ca-activated chloride channel family protein